jgi:hypothetical protein
MKNKLTLKKLYNKLPQLKSNLKKRQWGNVESMLIPSVLKLADECIEFLQNFETETEKLTRVCTR